jgi:hypothetical protein
MAEAAGLIARARGAPGKRRWVKRANIGDRETYGIH